MGKAQPERNTEDFAARSFL